MDIQCRGAPVNIDKMSIISTNIDKMVENCDGVPGTWIFNAVGHPHITNIDKMGEIIEQMRPRRAVKVFF